MRLNALEREVLAAWRGTSSDTPVALGPTGDVETWLRLALRLSLLSCRLVRSSRLGDLDGPVVLKTDASPLTSIELQIERMLVHELAQSPTPVTFLGEESTSGDGSSNIALAVDPIDGTWSLINRTETAATSIALLRDGAAFVGIIANPATAEIAYVADGYAPRLIQLSAFGEPDHAVDLPIPPAGPEGLLVSLHPQRAAGPVAKALARAWQNGELDMVRSAGGAPSLGLIEAAKGSFVYVNLWDRRETAAWDLAAGLLLLRAAGGEAVDLQGRPVRPVGHRGPFVAALHAEDRERVAAMTLQALTARSS